MGLTDKHLAYGDDIPQTQAEKDYYWELKHLEEKINKLEQEQCEDKNCISKQAVLEVLKKNRYRFNISQEGYYEGKVLWSENLIKDNACKEIEQLPPVTPKSKSEYEHDHEVVKAYNDGQAYILDKIRTEIENDWQFKKFPRSPWSCGLRRAIEIIDKHLKEVKE